MHYFEVAPTQIIRAGSATFTYSHETPLSIGHIVMIEVGKKKLVGVVVQGVKKPAYDVKSISEIIYHTPLPEQLVQLSTWMSTYYATHFALVLQTLLPRGSNKKRRAKAIVRRKSIRQRTKIVFTPDQEKAIAQLEDMSPGSALLHGVTGSGKTAVYIALARKTLSQNKSVILLVPEIALTSQLVDEFSHEFGDILLTHSRQTEAERHLVWQEALHSSKPCVVIGPRSALFLPVHSLGLIVIDEAHEPSFKQEQSPRYSALRAGTMLAQFHSAKLILGSATPLVADYYLAESSSRPIVTLKKRARKDVVAPTVDLIDMTKKISFKKHRFLSDKLLTSLTEAFTSGHQALIFHNRRGSASTTLCENCGWQAMCPHCFVPVTLHADAHHLRCHICSLTDRVPTSCPVCHHANIIHKGIGTKLIESELRKIFPDITIGRFDGDVASGQSVEQRYRELYDGTIQLIIGTQVIAKGLDLPKLRVVGVVQADAGLSLPDYSSSERTFQLLAQVVGRVGRSHWPTEVIVQSYQPAHPAVVDGLAQNYQQFYAHTLADRRHAHFPPFTFLLKLTCLYKTEAAAIKNAKNLASELRAKFPAIQILGPTPAFYERTAGTFRWQLVVKSQKRAELLNVVAELPPTHWQFELDPISLL